MELLETSIKALEIANLAADKIPIPGLSTAVGCALSIAKKAKDIKDTRDDCRALAKRVADFVLAVYQQLKNGSSDTGLKEYVTMFLLTRDRIRFVFSRDKIADEVKVLTMRLEDSFRMFMMRAALTIDDSMNTLTSGNLRLMQHIDDSARVVEIVVRDTGEIRTGLSDLTQRVRGSAAFDGNFRLFAHENLAYLEPIGDSAKLHHDMTGRHGDERTLVKVVARSQTGRVFRYRAVVEAAGDLTGTQVVVYEYPDRKSQQFVEAVNLARQSRRHPNLLAMLGYSRPGDPDQVAYIVMEGVWLGRKSFDEDWTCLSAQDPGFEVAVAMASVPLALPSPRQEGHDFYQRLSMVKWLDIPESDLDEMCIEFELGTGGGQTRWKRYQFSCIPVNTTLLIRQLVCALDRLDAASRMMRALPDLSVLQGQYACIGIAQHRAYFTETTITMSAHATEQVYPPLWFFVLQFDGNDGSAHDCNIPSGFWSSEKYPTSVPAGIIFDSTSQFERIAEGVEAPLFTWTQVLGDLVFTTRTKYAPVSIWGIEDELFAFREFQESHHSTGDTYASDSDDSAGDRVATDDSDEDDAEDSDTESLASGSSNEDHVLGVNHESPESDYEDATDAGDDSAEEYYSAEEDEATGLATGLMFIDSMLRTFRKYYVYEGALIGRASRARTVDVVEPLGLLRQSKKLSPLRHYFSSHIHPRMRS
ncbi:hypothetical protein VTO73DRAFT_10208 [Trametes versicolor]